MDTHITTGPLTPLEHGFTLAELMVTLAILAILSALAAPSFQDMIARNRLSVSSNELLVALQTARSEATRLARNAVVCPSTTGTGCTGGTSWHSGWMVFVDQSKDDVFTPTTDETTSDRLVRVWPALAPSMTITGPQRVRFHPEGNLVYEPNTAQFEVEVKAGITEKRHLCLFASGRTAVSKEACP
jgi:type IV fimbrial biogenesis protein FimT